MSETNHQEDDELLILVDEEGSDIPEPEEKGWKIAIVDDDRDVHRTTLFALQDVRILNRPLEFIHCYSKAETKAEFITQTDVAVILLDVVMETEHAGLELVDFIRNELKWKETRIILRTGQPGYAPEEEAIRDYDINDYKTKNELTRRKLLTSLTAAVRSYVQIKTIEASRNGLQQIIHASSAFTFESGIHEFSAGVITQIAALCNISPEGLLCAQEGDGSNSTPNFHVIASAGQYSNLMDASIEEIQNLEIRESLRYVLSARESLYAEKSMTLYIAGRGNRAMAAYIELPEPLSDINHELIQVFCTNLGICLDNLSLVSQLQTHAYYDRLLKLPNRVRLIQIIEHTLLHKPEGIALLLVDIDAFAEINDVLGHAWGDQLLIAVSKRLQNIFGDEVTIARVGVDVFGLLGPFDKLFIADLNNLIRQPFIVDDTQHSISATFGMVKFDDYSGSAIEALKDASIALKRSKAIQRGSCTIFTSEMGLQIRARATLTQKFHRGFAQGQLFVVYQPQVNLNTGGICGVEALVRWRDEKGNLISPVEFIPLAEQSGLIVQLGHWVLTESCLMMQRFIEQGINLPRVGVNVSAIQFRQPDFCQQVEKILAETGLNPRALELEVTESLTMSGTQELQEKLRYLQSLGITIAIDDFGTGYSSLSYLDQLPADRLKIDRSFVIQIDAAGGPRIAQMITSLGNALGLAIIAEGIEYAHHWSRLRDMGCHEGQGFYIAKPMGEQALSLWLREYRPLLP